MEKRVPSKFKPLYKHLSTNKLFYVFHGGRGGKLANKAWSLDRYDQAEEMGYKIERFHPDSILSGYVINWIKSELARIEDGANKTISTD
ncbi:hypothetical protein FDG83_gp53 [Acinetobacter phage YMC11/11/R3177]|uniref:Uncharacterized protein n=1 Tax=Acinetobacter phage YMC11/11/R3177 TaxID=1628721 RepID=A0A0D4DBL3_9CAUD|nr:hypothetical protein FDG83_gp53 [Acinetobacter phage YMC11/11/R3177]AJT61369.1 hypothetical protein ABA3177_00530 [Acinetobacter phage YMC11/11/R3177]